MISLVHSAPFLGRPLHRVTGGRFFCRESGGGGFGFVGVVELPAVTKTETLVPVRLNERLWMDLACPADPYERIGIPRLGSRELGEFDANNLLTSMRFAQGAIPDAFEVFVRNTPMAHENPAMSWVFIVGAATKRMKATPADGLYELGRDGGVKLIDETKYNGTNLGTLLNEPLWAKSGQFGFATSMEPLSFSKWVAEDRARNAKRDPLFGAYMERMATESPIPLVYTSEENQSREAISRRIFCEITGKADPAASPSNSYLVTPEVTQEQHKSRKP